MPRHLEHLWQMIGKDFKQERKGKTETLREVKRDSSELFNQTEMEKVDSWSPKLYHPKSPQSSVLLLLTCDALLTEWECGWPGVCLLRKWILILLLTDCKVWKQCICVAGRGLYLSRKPHFQLIQFLAILIFSCLAFIYMWIFGWEAQNHVIFG